MVVGEDSPSVGAACRRNKDGESNNKTRPTKNIFTSVTNETQYSTVAI